MKFTQVFALSAAFVGGLPLGAQSAYVPQTIVFTGASDYSGQVFSITEPMVEIGEVHVDQVSPNAAAKVAQVKKRYVGQEYDVNSSGAALSTNLTDAYQDLGYLDVAIEPPTHGAPQVSAMAITIDLATAAHEGSVYHVSQMVWPETAVISKQAMADAAQLKAGDVASRIMMLSAQARVKGRFDAAGYLDAKLSQSDRKDDATHEIAYTFSVNPGEQYKVAGVKTSGMNAEQQTDFDKTWKLGAGQAYDGDYVKTFVKKATGDRPFQGYAFKSETAADRATHTATITISVVKAGARPS